MVSNSTTTSYITKIQTWHVFKIYNNQTRKQRASKQTNKSKFHIETKLLHLI
jgi:hypothetical protein